MIECYLDRERTFESFFCAHTNIDQERVEWGNFTYLLTQIYSSSISLINIRTHPSIIQGFVSLEVLA
jgi:hypothetical protein